MARIWTVMALSGLLLAPPATWTWPVDHPHLVLRDFDAPLTEWGPGHRGLDLAASVGSAVRAPVTGRIWFADRVATRGVITIRTDQGHLVSMEPVITQVQRGQRVRAGQRVGTLASGHCPSGCLHIGLRVEGEYRSPALELGILRRSVLQSHRW